MLTKIPESDSSTLHTMTQGIPTYVSYYKPVKRKQSFPKTPINLDQFSSLITAAIINEKNSNKMQSVWANIGIPGLDHVVDKQRKLFSRCFWGLIVLACLATCVYQIYTRVWLFLQYPVAANVVVVQPSSIKFPQITICPAETDALRKLKNEYLKANPDRNEDYNSIELVDLIGFNNYTAQQIWEKSKLPDFDQLIMKETEGRDESYAVTISEKRTVQGVCKVLNILDEIRYYGMSTELKIIMNTSDDQLGKTALWVTLEMDGDQPNSNSKLPAPYGISMGVSIKLKQFQSISTQLNPCTDATTSINCFDLCLNELQTKQTACKLPFMRRNHHVLCSNASEAKKTYSIVQEIFYNTSFSTCNCMPKCYSDLYTFSREIFDLKQGKTTVSFYYSTNQIEIMQESLEYPLFSMLCDVGGNLGLYLGLSILSLFEIFESLSQV